VSFRVEMNLSIQMTLVIMLEES